VTKGVETHFKTSISLTQNIELLAGTLVKSRVRGQSQGIDEAWRIGEREILCCGFTEIIEKLCNEGTRAVWTAHFVGLTILTVIIIKL
jgi:hypothetical protein